VLFFITVGRDANLPCVVEHLGTYKVSIKSAEKQFQTNLWLKKGFTAFSERFFSFNAEFAFFFSFEKLLLRSQLIKAQKGMYCLI
jgi:hypothetical protein